MNVFIEKENKQVVLDKSCTGDELFKELDINPSTVLLTVNSEVALSSETIPKDADVKILSVISGG